MGRTLDTAIGTLPKARRDRINARYRVLKNEVESLQGLCRAAGKAQTDIAASLHISQPSVSKIEKQTDTYLSTLRNYVKAVGGDLGFVVRFPKQKPVHLSRLGEVLVSGFKATGNATAPQTFRVPVLFPILYNALLGIGFLYYWPNLLALVSRTAPPAIKATMMGVVFLTLFISNLTLGRLGALYEVIGPAWFWALHAAIAATGTVLALLLARPLVRGLESMEA